MEGIIKFKSIHGFKGVLYDLHNDPVHGEAYQMTVYDDNGNEILHSDNAKPKTAEELKVEILTIQREVEHMRHVEKEREKGWRRHEMIRMQQEQHQRKESIRALSKEIGKWVVMYKIGDKYKMMFKDGKPVQFETANEAQECIEGLKALHPSLTFRKRKRLINKDIVGV